jgi:hypothetical protein
MRAPVVLSSLTHVLELCSVTTRWPSDAAPTPTGLVKPVA